MEQRERCKFVNKPKPLGYNRQNINIGSEEERPSLVSASADMKNKDIVNALRLIAANQEMLLSKWQEIHGI